MCRLEPLPLALLLLTTLASEPVIARPLELKVVSYNVWGLPFGIAPNRDERVAAIGPALAKLRPDVVALQEVWIPENGETLTKALAAAGLPHAVFQSEGFLGSGLLIASRYPLEVEGFHEFRLAGKAHKVWHGDWFARKGVLIVRVKSPQGMVRVANTHLHATYGSQEYWPVQISQALQAARVLGTHGANPPARGDDPARPPLILCGDINSKRDGHSFRTLTTGAGLEPTPGDDLRIDWVLARSGGALSARVTGAKHVLTEPETLSNGVRATLSDHPCVLATVQLRKGAPKRWRPKKGITDWKIAADASLPIVEAALQAARESQSRSRGWTLLLLLGAATVFAIDRWLRRKREKKGCLLPLATLSLLHLAVWCLYLGVVYEPQLVAELRAARSALLPAEK